MVGEWELHVIQRRLEIIAKDLDDLAKRHPDPFEQIRVEQLASRIRGNAADAEWFGRKVAEAKRAQI